MAAASSTRYLYDGVVGTSGGMNSGLEPELLGEDELSYIKNGAIGTGFITHRPPTIKMAITAPDGGTLSASTQGYFYGACVYTSDAGISSLIASIGGNLFRFTPQYDVNDNPLNAIAVDAQANGLVQDTATAVQHWLQQAERWVVWNDGINLPIFWDGSATPPTARRSFGYAGNPNQNPPQNELPQGRMMAYGLGQLWMALPDGTSFMFSDYVGYSSGTAQYQFRDAVLKTKMNSSLATGGNFRVPGNVGQIQGLSFIALLDNTLGTGPLQVFTEQCVFGCIAPITATNLSSLNGPILTETLKSSGSSSQDAIVLAQGDIFFRSSDGQIRSLVLARRDFYRWGNTPCSFEVNRILDGDPMDLLPFDSGVNFDNGMLMACNPVQGNLGVYHTGLISLSFDRVSFMKEKFQPAYNGLWQGLNVLKILTGMFNNVQRCFAFVYNTATNAIEIHEFLTADGSGAHYQDSDANPITLQLESRALFWKGQNKTEFDLVRLQGGEMAVQDLQGVTKFLVEFSSVYDPGWHPWANWTVDNTNGATPYVARMGLGSPPSVNNSNPATNRPYEVDYAFQVRVTITGKCKFMGLRLAATIEPQPEFEPPYTGT